MQSLCHPPDNQAMRDDIIGTVVQRKRPVHCDFIAKASLDVHDALEQRSSSGVADRSRPARIPANSGKCSTMQRPLTMQEIRAIADKDTMGKLHAIMKAHRDRRNLIQQRHIRKKKKKMQDLVDSIPKLRNEIEQLQLQRFTLRERLPKESAWFVAVEYFRVLQYGLSGLEAAQERFLNFLSASMAPDIETGNASGLQDLVRSWKIFTQAFPDCHIQLQGLKQLTRGALVATTSTRVTLTHHTLQYLFRSLADDNKTLSKRRKEIVAKVVDQHIVMRGSVRFDWDETTKRVVGLHSHTDMLTPMLNLLGSLEDVSLVFSHAAITLDGTFIPIKPPSE